MRKMSRSLLIVAWIVSMLAAGMWARAQAPGQPPAPRTLPPGPPGPDDPARIISGNDFGFRVQDVRGDRLVGVFVARVNGQWREVEESRVTKRLTER
jgi:hypothetical protein